MTPWPNAVFNRPFGLMRRRQLRTFHTQRARLSALRLEERSVPATITVTSPNDSGAGTLRQAISDAADNKLYPGADTINFDATKFANGVTITLSSELSVADTAALTIDGTANGIIPPTISANSKGRAFNINSSGQSITLVGLTIENGLLTDANGGGILVQAGDVTLSACTVKANECDGTNTRGGGIAVNAGSLTLSATTVSGNMSSGSSSSAGGGIFSNGVPVTLTNGSAVTGNQTNGDSGVGIYVGKSGSLTMSDSSVTANVNGFYGGGIFSLGSVSLTRCTVSGNSATSLGGGGLYVANGSFTMDESTVSDNTANSGKFGGGMLLVNISTVCDITNSTISGNKAGQGGGVFVNSGSVAPRFLNCTIANNQSQTTGSNVGGGGLGIATKGTAQIHDCTLAYNSAKVNGGAIFATNTITLQNCIVAKNDAANKSDTNNITATTVNGTNCLFGDTIGFTFGTNTNNNIGADPKLATTLASNGGGTPTLSLASNSPAIDAGNAVLTKLSASLSSGSTTISVSGTDMLIVGQLVRINSEIMQITAVGSLSATVLRAQEGTTAASHATNDTLSPAYDQRGRFYARTVNHPAGAGSAADMGAYELQGLPRIAKVSGYVLDSNGDPLVSYSHVTGVMVDFDQPIEISAVPQWQVFTLALKSSPYTAVSIAFVYTGAKQRIMLTFTGGNVVSNPDGNALLDGRYVLNAVSQYIYVAGDPTGTLDGNGNGTADGSPTDDVATDVVALFGNSDMDGDVDAIDFGAFRAAFGTGQLQFDWDGDGDVDATDFGQFRSHFGMSV